MADGTHRLFRLVDLLQARGASTTADLAAALGVSERTVRRDLVRLADLDIPVQARPGRGGGVSVEPGALLAPLRFTDDELLAVHLGLLTLRPGRDGALACAAASAARRLETVLTPRARDRARALVDAVAAPPSRRGPDASGGADAERVLQIAEAVHARRRLRMRYGSPTSGETTREVDPYGLVRLERWYLAAHCHLRGALRTFRLDRIRALGATGASFERPGDFDAFGSVTASIALAPVPGSVLCRVHLETDIESAAAVLPPTAVFLEPVDDGVLLSTRAWEDELPHTALHLLRLPWRVTILEPEDLRDALRAVAARAHELVERRPR